MMTDSDAYIKYPKLRHFYNKLWLSEKLGYRCGPSGIEPQESDTYIVRPIMNLSGMGVSSSKSGLKQEMFLRSLLGIFGVSSLKAGTFQ